MYQPALSMASCSLGLRGKRGISEDKEKVLGTGERGEGGEITSQILSCIPIPLLWYDLVISRLGITPVLYELRHMESVPEGQLLSSHG